MSSLLQPARSDEQLTAAIAGGDHAAFEELYRRYARPLAAYGSRVLRDRSRGEDVAQTALARAFEALQRGTEPLRVKPWLYKIALNTALEQRAKLGEVLDGESEEHEGGADDTSAQRADILAAVQVLPERQRMVFFLREVRGLTVGEVASRLDLTSQQVEQSLFAARNRLAEELVFGSRVDCRLVQSIDPDSLTRFERRALKGHLRACPSCRRNTGFSVSTIALWFRDALAWLAGGGGVSAAKLGAAVVTATVAASTPVTAPMIMHTILHRHLDGHAVDTRAVDAVPLASELSPTSLRPFDTLDKLLVPQPRVTSPVSGPFPSAPLTHTTPTTPSAAAPPDLAADPPQDPAPADAMAADSTPVDPAPADPAPTDTTPANPTPTDTVPTDTTPTDPGATPPDAPPDPAAASAPPP
jgi:RNA polymerase sigma factor (sigma-70 family)